MALEDGSLPWNVSASIRGSHFGSVGRGYGPLSSTGGFPSSVGPTGVSSVDRRASRMTSASPLLMRGRERYSSLELPVRELHDEAVQVGEALDPNIMEDFELYGPAAAVSTQTAAETQWIKATLNQESQNFLEFVKAEIANRRISSLEGGYGAVPSLTFENLLPPSQHSSIVAAQGLHHLLALATKGLLGVHQEVAFGPIIMELSDGV